jgi:hypothetical protein
MPRATMVYVSQDIAKAGSILKSVPGGSGFDYMAKLATRGKVSTWAEYTQQLQGGPADELPLWNGI